jgi:hypothetical protein
MFGGGYELRTYFTMTGREFEVEPVSLPSPE